MNAKDKTWNTPVKKGGVYCAPFCGRGCTVKEFADATAAAANLSEQLYRRLGGTWEPRIWENMGWHWEVNQGPVSVHRDRGNTHYTAYIFSATRGILATGHSSSPVRAIKKAVAEYGGKVCQDALRLVQAQAILSSTMEVLP